MVLKLVYFNKRMDVIAMLQAGFTAVAKVFGFTQHRSELNNAPEVRASKEGQQQEKQVEQNVKVIEKQDVDATRDRIGGL